jgi:hypothetical protein
MLDTDALLLRDPRDFFFGAGMASVSDVLVSSDCVSPAADGMLVRRESLPLCKRAALLSALLPRATLRQAVNASDANWWRNVGVGITLEQNGNFLDSNFNTGVLFFRANAAARAAARLWISTVVSEGHNLGGAHAWDDQQAFGELMRVGPEKRYMLYPRAALVPGGGGRVLWAMNGRVRLGILPVQLFANGHTFFVQSTQLRPGAPQPFTVHNTFQFYGAAGKRARFMGAGLWWNVSAAGGARYRARMAADEAFVTWDPNPPPSLRGTACDEAQRRHACASSAPPTRSRAARPVLGRRRRAGAAGSGEPHAVRCVRLARLHDAGYCFYLCVRAVPGSWRTICCACATRWRSPKSRAARSSSRACPATATATGFPSCPCAARPDLSCSAPFCARWTKSST